MYDCAFLRCAIVNVSNRARRVQINWRDSDGAIVIASPTFSLGPKEATEADRICFLGAGGANYCEFTVEGRAKHFRANGTDLDNPANVILAH